MQTGSLEQLVKFNKNENYIEQEEDCSIKKWTEGLSTEGRLLSIGPDSHKPPSLQVVCGRGSCPKPRIFSFQLAGSQKKDPCLQSPSMRSSILRPIKAQL